MSILPQMNPTAFITNFVSPFIETRIMSLEGNAERSAANLKCGQETLFLLSGLLQHQMLQQKSQVGVWGSCESCPVEILAAAESWTRHCPAWQRWGGFAFRFTPPGDWQCGAQRRARWERAGGRAGRGVSPDTLQHAMAFLYCCVKCPSPGKRTIWAARLLFWATTLENGFPRAPLFPLFFPEGRCGD